jgi:hypothetical protein
MRLDIGVMTVYYTQLYVMHISFYITLAIYICTPMQVGDYRQTMNHKKN